ncbi:OmpA family protein [Diaphorobacter nitroreducens]|uniref:OmpA family protein n=1 Tax=Diaphorobacter nitroreducens TaxID=164759 RepID=UPI0028986BC7|nr:OmpA family protein [Diaphorobacter nitroreducens]
MKGFEVRVIGGITKSICCAKWLASVLLFVGLTPAWAQTHSLLSGMPGYKVQPPKVVEFGSYTEGDLFYCQPGKRCTSGDPGFSDEGKLVAEGKVTVQRYSTEKPAGTLAVFRNYENAIREMGGRRLTYTSTHDTTNVFLIDRQGAKVWIVLSNAYDSGYQLTYIEAKPLQQVVKAGQLADAIHKQGFATLYINFDNNKSDVKPEAKPAMEEVVALLKADSVLRLSIEGHTDNVGNAVTNKTLSQARAQSVVKALVASGIDAKRLQAKGFGSEVPVADNRSEEGRAKNRRVELVKLK